MISDDEKHKEAMREVEMRRRVYPQWVAKGKLRQDEADRRIAVMEAIAKDYKAKELFDA